MSFVMIDDVDDNKTVDPEKFKYWFDEMLFKKELKNNEMIIAFGYSEFHKGDLAKILNEKKGETNMTDLTIEKMVQGLKKLAKKMNSAYIEIDRLKEENDKLRLERDDLKSRISGGVGVQQI